MKSKDLNILDNLVQCGGYSGLTCDCAFLMTSHIHPTGSVRSLETLFLSLIDFSFYLLGSCCGGYLAGTHWSIFRRYGVYSVTQKTGVSLGAGGAILATDLKLLLRDC